MEDNLRNNTEFCYTLSSNGNMVKEAIHSIKTLKNYVSSDKINVIFTPPVDPEDIEKISSLDVEVVQKKNRAETFQVSDYDYDRSYGDKMWLCSIESQNLVFLDCDTLVLEDIWEVIEGDYEFKARPTEEEMTEEWEQLFRENQLKLVEKMFNAGFLVFKNKNHQAIEENWEKHYRQLENKSYSKSGNIHREQYALALAVSELDIEEMDESEHLMEWTDSIRADSIVHHLSGPQWTYKEYLQEFILRTKNLDLIEALKSRI